MNCYYSNLIEGRYTSGGHRAGAQKTITVRTPANATCNLKPRRIAVQQWIDEGGLKGGLSIKVEGIREIHRRFYASLPEDLLWVEDAATKQRVHVVPGELRKRDVQVGNHVAVSPGALPRFLERFAQVYGNVGKTESILSTAAAHHRLLWIHPFMDGNGRVARLMSHSMMLDTRGFGPFRAASRAT